MTAEEIKGALRPRHPATWPGMATAPGEWTVIEEFANIDLLAMSAWSGARRVGYEVKVSRADLRRELLKPWKRLAAVTMCNEFYFAVPAGLLKKEELAFEQPEEWTNEDFQRGTCTNPDCHTSSRRSTRGRHYSQGDSYMRRYEGATVRLHASERLPIDADWPYSSYEIMACCAVCKGRRTVGKSRVEREAPTLWIPPDVGLVEVFESGVARAKKKAPYTEAKLMVSDNRQLHDLVRWVSARPDPRHSEMRRAA